MDASQDRPTSPVLPVIEPREEVHVVTEAAGAHRLVTNRLAETESAADCAS